jgi:hypothetical protein
VLGEVRCIGDRPPEGGPVGWLPISLDDIPGDLPLSWRRYVTLRQRIADEADDFMETAHQMERHEGADAAKLDAWADQARKVVALKMKQIVLDYLRGAA